MNTTSPPFDREEAERLEEAAVHALIEALYGFGLISGKEKKALDQAMCHRHRGEKTDLSH